MKPGALFGLAIVFQVIAWILSLGFIVVICWIAWHFIQKFW